MAISVLIIEDHALNMQLLVEILEMHGYQVYQAGTAQTGIELARVKRPQLILMDIGLPGMNGLQATKLLKEDYETRDIPIMIITSHALKGDQELGRAAGCDEYLTKPINIHAVREKVYRLMQRRSEPLEERNR